MSVNGITSSQAAAAYTYSSPVKEASAAEQNSTAKVEEVCAVYEPSK